MSVLSKKNNIDLNKEWQFLKECEKASHTEIAGKQRFIELLTVISNIRKPAKILDVGGTLSTARWLKAKFPEAEISILNKSKKELSSYSQVIFQDAQSFKTKEKYDLIFALEILEHVYNPDGLIASSLMALKPKGYFIISTPNLACFYNRLFLLFGWAPGNYSPSLRYITGNPFFKHLNNKISDFGLIGDHKSVFTRKGLSELLVKYCFKILDFRGFSYSQEERILSLNNQSWIPPFAKIRLFLNKLLPSRLKEGMIFVCQAPEKLDLEQLSKMILKKDFWEL